MRVLILSLYFNFLGGYLVITARYIMVSAGYCLLTGGHWWLLLVPTFSMNVIFARVVIKFL